jgi:hypothetical protein
LLGKHTREKKRNKEEKKRANVEAHEGERLVLLDAGVSITIYIL